MPLKGVPTVSAANRSEYALWEFVLLHAYTHISTHTHVYSIQMYKFLLPSTIISTVNALEEDIKKCLGIHIVDYNYARYTITV